MANRVTRAVLLSAAATMALAMSGLGMSGRAVAQDEASSGPASSEKVVVFGTKYRNRSEATAPVLDYGLDFFQKFEPLTVGDALKRTPSVAFLSDVLEYDGVRLRGLDPGYTQILIDGEKVPGSGLDRSFFVDRIPAELIERVEIVRSASADRSGDALAGAINIILRDALSLDGGYIKGGALHFTDSEVKPVISGVYGGELGNGRFLIGGNVQGRHNPKDKLSLRFEPDSGAFEFDNREDQTDVRDGTDYSANTSVTFPIGGGEIAFSGAYVRTERTETEVSREYDELTSILITDLQEEERQLEDIFQENFTASVKLTAPLFGGETKLKFSYAGFIEDITNTVFADEYDAGLIDDSEGEREIAGLRDDEFAIAFSHTFQTESTKVKVGVDYEDKERKARIQAADFDFGAMAFEPFDAVTGGIYQITEERTDPFIKMNTDLGALEIELGLRLELTDVTVEDDTGIFRNDYAFALPSFHVKYKASDDDRFRFSFAGTVRRPDFDSLAPALLEEEVTDDDDFLGNPRLQPEQAWGFDLSYERRLGRRGVAGVNVFYRSVEDRIELASTGIVSSTGDGFVYQPRNIGDGFVYGVEFDLSTPLSFAGLDDTGVFLNYSWLDSEVTDPATREKRRFNDQAEFVLNLGFIQDLPSWLAAFGATYRQQGDAFGSVFSQTVETSYGADLEVFIEKRFGENFVLRFTGSNLLDASKDETFFKWDNLPDRLSGDIDDVDEFELETEKSGPVFQLVGRYAF